MLCILNYIDPPPRKFARQNRRAPGAEREAGRGPGAAPQRELLSTVLTFVSLSHPVTPGTAAIRAHH